MIGMVGVLAFLRMSVILLFLRHDSAVLLSVVCLCPVLRVFPMWSACSDSDSDMPVLSRLSVTILTARMPHLFLTYSSLILHLFLTYSSLIPFAFLSRSRHPLNRASIASRYGRSEAEMRPNSRLLLREIRSVLATAAE